MNSTYEDVEYSAVGGKKGVNMANDTKPVLYEKAKKANIRGRSKMTKDELVDALRQHYKEIGRKISKRK
jgi:hypothetical protein